MTPTVVALPARQKRAPRTIDIDALSTEALLRLHARHFAPLDRRGKQRLVDTASMNGWDRSWDEVVVAA